MQLPEKLGNCIVCLYLNSALFSSKLSDPICIHTEVGVTKDQR